MPDQNSVPNVFIATPVDMLRSNCVKLDRREIGEIVRCLPNNKNKISPGFPAVTTARITPKICLASPRQCTQSAPDLIQISSLSAEL